MLKGENMIQKKYTTDDVVFHPWVPTNINHDISDEKAEMIWHETKRIALQMQHIWLKHFADSKTISFHPIVKVFAIDAMAEGECPSNSAAFAGIPPVLDYNFNGSISISIERLAEGNDIVHTFIHEMGHIYDAMVNYKDTEHSDTHDAYEDIRKQLMSDSSSSLSECFESHGSKFLQNLVDHCFANTLRYNNELKAEGDMTNIVQEKFPDLYNEHSSYVHRFHGTLTQIMDHMRAWHQANVGKVGHQQMTRQKIEKFLTPLVRKKAPLELLKHWKCLVNNWNKDRDNNLSSEVVGNIEGTIDGVSIFNDDNLTKMYADINEQGRYVQLGEGKTKFYTKKGSVAEEFMRNEAIITVVRASNDR
tara:strand:- start:1640 stop:2725 length:1086 start_codon:yes stop_codon:yes gene_type:complete